MGKQKRQLVVAGILLILVAAAYIGMRYYNGQPKEDETTETHTVTQDAMDLVTKFSFTNENGSFTFVKADDVWTCEEAPDMKVDESVLEGMIEKAVAVTSENQIEAVEDMAQYGLEEPAITVYYETAESNKTLKIGDYNSSISLYYLGLEGSDAVYTVESTFRTSFTKSLEELEKVEEEETSEETADEAAIDESSEKTE